jgi:hypothetical protein
LPPELRDIAKGAKSASPLPPPRPGAVPRLQGLPGLPGGGSVRLPGLPGLPVGRKK